MPPVAMDTTNDASAKNFDDIVNTHFAGGKKAAFGGDRRALFAQLASDPATPVEELYVHLNVEANDPNEFARGYSAVLESSAVVNIDYLHQDMFGQVMLFAIEPLAGEPAFESADFDGKHSKAADNINFVVQQHTVEEPSLQRALFACDAQSKVASPLRDGAKWQAALGDDGRVQVLKQEIGDDAYRFFLLVHVGKTQASEELYRWVYKQEPGSLTYAAFLASPQFKYVQSVNQRNAQRIAVKAAKALSISVKTVDDKLAFTSSVHEMPPQLAVPIVHNEYNTVRSGTWRYKSVFLVYDNTYCTSKSRGGLLLLQDPRSSVLLFPDPASSSDVIGAKSARVGENAALNEAAASFPVTLGRTMTPDEAMRKASSDNFTAETVKSINKRVIWEGKERYAKHWSNHRVAADLFNKLNVVGNAQQRQVLNELYGNNGLSAIVRLQPVIAKISADD